VVDREAGEMLAEIQARLDKHFLSLSRQRAALGYPVYALEHGLTPAEIDLLRSKLARELSRERILSAAHWLSWIVVATEIGYIYDGDEYWDSFAQAIPDWQRYGSRSTIRTWFVEFAQRYRGFRPTGRWAQHFSIIAWPIAHAILPRDLQTQFARHLYGLRYELARGLVQNWGCQCMPAIFAPVLGPGVGVTLSFEVRIFLLEIQGPASAVTLRICR
jgi:hypothetical protein